MSNRSETMKLIRDLRKQGFEVDRTGSGHWKVHKGKGPSVTLGFSPNTGGLHKTYKRLEELGYKRKGQ